MDRRQELVQEIRRKQLIQEIQQKQSAPKEADVINDEMPDWLSDSRSVVKNLSNSDDESLKVLHERHPGAEFKMSHGGDIIARKKGETSWGKLDPSFSPFSNPIGTIKDLWNDTKDIGYDALQGVAEAGGALAGGVAGLGVGTLPAAMAGGAAGAGVASTLKEALRKKYGLTDEMSMGNIATDAAFGGAIPGVFHGAGVVAKAGMNKAAPWLYGKATGLSTQALKKIADGGGDRTSSEILEMIGKTRGALDESIDARKSDLKAGFLAKRGSGTQVDIGPVIKQLDDAIEVARAKRARSGSNLLGEEERSLMAMKDRIWAANDHGKIRVQTKHTSQNIGHNEAPKQVSKFDPVRGGYVEDAAGKPRSVQYLDDGADIQHISGNMDVSDAMDMKEAIKNAYVDYSDDLGGKIGKGNTASIQEERAALSQIKSLDDAIYGDDEAGRALKKEYGSLIDDASYLNSKVNSDEKLMHTLRNYRKGKNKVLKGNIDKLDKSAQEKFMDMVNELELHDHFDESIQGNYIKSGADTLLGKSPLSKTLQAGGALTGYLTGGGYAGSAIGGLAGRKLGDLLTSPESIKAITRYAKKNGIRVQDTMKAIGDRPELMAIIYGATNASSK